MTDDTRDNSHNPVDLLNPADRTLALEDAVPSAAECLTRVRAILETSRHQALQSVNTAMVRAYWQVGREIVEEEQRGRGRADYGIRLIEELAERLTQEFGRGFNARNLWYMKDVYLAFPDLGNKKVNAPRSESQVLPPSGPALSWTHYRLLSRVEGAEARSFYAAECAKARWSTRELERQVASLLFERLALSTDKAGLLALAEQGHEPHTPADLVKDPYVLEFTGLPQSPQLTESDLEQALMDRLQAFLLEMGRDFFFVARQKRLTIDGDHFYVDLVFYHRALRCFVLVDLKVGRLTQQDIGQMLLYTGYYEAEETREGENPPVGLILCTDKNEAVVRYTLSGRSQAVFASRYKLHLPTEEELQVELRRERDTLETERHLQGTAELDASETDEKGRDR